MDNSMVFLETYVLQQDMRIRLPKAILSNVGAEKGKTMFDIYFSADDNTIVLKVHKNVAGENK
ncbi:MAG: sucrose-6-phosphate hydrolase [Treponema sp.]|nr:sucrose-6-phosphate hydrolase [Treponema sp.]